MKMDVTFGLTAYNAQDTILRAIDSAIACDPAYIIVCDDGSTDKTRKLLKDRAKEESRLKIEFNPENIGVAAARNRLIECCQTRFLVFLDDDDEAMPDRIEDQREAFDVASKKFGHSQILCYGARRAEGCGKVSQGLGVDGAISGEDLLLYAAVGIRRGNFHPGLMGTGTLFAPTEALRLLGGFDPALRRNEDVELVMRAGLMKFACISTPKVVLKQYHTTGIEKSASVEADMRNLILRKHFITFIRYWPLLPAAYFLQTLGLRVQSASPLAQKGLRAAAMLFVNPIDALNHIREHLKIQS